MKKTHLLIPTSFFILIFTSLSALSAFLPKAVKAEGCGGPVPDKPLQVQAVSGPGAGQVTLYWDQSPHANRYAIAYGVESGNYIYGADNIGGERDRKFTVEYLQPGRKYYFVLAAASGSCSSPFSAEVSVQAIGGKPVLPPVSASVSPVSSKTSTLPTSSGKQNLRAVSGPNIGEVTLYWQHADNADNYHLVYGTERDNFQYGALNIGKITSFTVKYLNPGTAYYFALVPLVGGRSLDTTDQVKATAKAPVEIVEVIEVSREDLGLPKKVSVSPPVKEEVKVQISPAEKTVDVKNETPEVLYQEEVNIDDNLKAGRERPVCQKVGTTSEGWYWPSTSSKAGQLVRRETCDGCFTFCSRIGLSSEGWYNSCSNKLVTRAKCGSD